MKKYVVLKPFNNRVFYKNRIFKIDNGSNPFFNLRKHLQKRGIIIDTLDLQKQSLVDKQIYIDMPYPWQVWEWMKLVFCPWRKNILICIEASLVNPFSYLRFLHIFFHRVYVWDKGLADGRKYFVYNLAIARSGKLAKRRNYADKKFLVMINANKSALWPFKLLAKYKTDLYQERQKAVEFFEKETPQEFYLYGRGWGDLKSNRGWVENKIETLSKFQFCLCFENTAAPGYLTEKIFDCFKAGCVPIYYGAPNVLEYVPKACFIDFRDFKNYEELLTYLRGISRQKYESYCKAAKKFFQSKTTRETWFEKAFEDFFVKVVNS